MKKNWYILSALALIGVIILLSLTYFTEKPNSKNHGFTRKMSPSKLALQYEKKMSGFWNRIVGFTPHHIFLSAKNPNILGISDWELKHEDTVVYSRSFKDEVLLAYELAIDSPRIRLFAGNLSVLLTSNFYDTSQFEINFATPLFTKASLISPQSAVLRAFDSSRRKQVFTKVDLQTGKVMKEVDLIPNQEDAGFSTDGWLQYDSSTNRIIYLCSYENRFFCMDTSLKLLYISRTIDTTNTNPFISHLFKNNNDGGSLKPAAPIVPVNMSCAVDNGRLFVLSTLKADNSSLSEFRNNSVLDVYSIQDGSYQLSFVIPNMEGRRINSFRVYQDKIIVNHQPGLRVYQF